MWVADGDDDSPRAALRRDRAITLRENSVAFGVVVHSIARCRPIGSALGCERHRFSDITGT
jgi:hypothetical protein